MPPRALPSSRAAATGDKLAPLVKEIEAAGGKVHARSLDARKEEEIISFLNDADKHAPLEVCIFNIGANVNFPILETTERVFRKVWEMACYSGFLAGREAARLMLPRGQGNIFFTGATASRCAAAAAMPPLPAPNSACALWRRRWRANSGPKNIHVAHLIIDSGVDTEWVRQHRAGSARAQRARRSQSADAAGLGCDVLLAALPAAERAPGPSSWKSAPSVRSGRERATMELALSPDDAAFRDEVRAFIAEKLSEGNARPQSGDRPDERANRCSGIAFFYKKGWIAPLWPKEYGGPGWSITRRFIFEQETSRAGTLPPSGVQRHHGRSRHLLVRQRRAEAEVLAADLLR